jgi:hypothetical protein
VHIGFGWGELKEKKTFWKHLCRWEHNIIVNLKAIGLEGVDLIYATWNSDKWRLL